MSAGNRLTAEQLAELAPGDTVTIEYATDLGRPRQATGTVVRIEGPHVVVHRSGSRGGSFIERYGGRDGVRIGGLTRAQLVQRATTAPASTAPRRHLLRVDAAYRAWARDRADVGKLRELQAAVSESLASVDRGR